MTWQKSLKNYTELTLGDLFQENVKAEQIFRARQSMANFALYVDEKYFMNWHHQLICDRLDKLIIHEIKRLMIFMPPRHGKSKLVSRKLPAYIFGKNPDAKIISASYSADLATAMNRDVQRIIDSERYNEIFPETTLNGRNVKTVSGGALRNSEKFEIVGHKGFYRSAGVDGGITGMGADFIIIDDPIKNRKDANSPTVRKNIFDWYTSTLYTRLEKNACILLTMTRWHEDDLAGRLLERAQKKFRSRPMGNFIFNGLQNFYLKVRRNLLKKEISGLVEFNPVGGKEERAISITPYCEAGNIFLPDPADNAWVHDFINDLLTFPNGRYKDTVDAFVQGVLYLMEKHGDWRNFID